MKILQLSFLILLTANCLLFGGAKKKNGNAYVQKLQQAGFPADYAVKLQKLHKLHPKWRFMPLHVTKLDARYTWDYVLNQETEKPSRSLVSGSKAFEPYRYAKDENNYDAGCRRASREAVAFFLDPRNFLNERDIFQFEDLSGGGNFQAKDIESVLAKTVWETYKLENGKRVSQYLLKIGKELKVSPLHLASRLRMEQGNGTPLVDGKCGTLLDEYYIRQTKTSAKGKPVLPPAPGSVTETLKQYDGLYNFFNIEASGTGAFTIYLNGMKEASKGTPEKQKDWKGSPKWNTRWKAIYGGARKIADNYVGNYQNTRYLQKWNVDARCKTPKGTSRNFWGQYMQNISASFEEAKESYRSLKENNLLDAPFVFLIPVYEQMPKEPAPDPAEGTCYYIPLPPM